MLWWFVGLLGCRVCFFGWNEFDASGAFAMLPSLDLCGAPRGTSNLADLRVMRYPPVRVNWSQRDRFGMRLEDIVVIGADGAPEPLNTVDHDLVVVDH